MHNIDIYKKDRTGNKLIIELIEISWYKPMNKLESSYSTNCLYYFLIYEMLFLF